MQLESSQLLRRLKPLFQENFEKFGELGAAVSVWQNGKPIIDLCGGFQDARRENPWMSDTFVLVWSATKGIGSACVLHTLQEHKIDISQLVANIWPEFAKAGKEKVNARGAMLYSSKTPNYFRAVPKNRPTGSDFYADLVTPGTLALKTFTSPYGLHSISKMNEHAIRAHPIVSFGGIGSASALAKFYSMLANGGKFEGQTFFSEKTIAWMTTTIADGMDSVFQIPTAFSAGFMKDSRLTAKKMFGPSRTSFGHPGAGGSHAFCDPQNGIGFAYVMNQMEQSLLPNEKSLRLVDAIYR